jgi:hypothetical protein
VSFVAKRLFPLYRDHELIRSALSIRFNPHDPAHVFYVEHHDLPANGFLPLPTGVAPTAAAVDQYRAEYGYKLSRFGVAPAALARLQAFISLAKSRGITVVLVNMPVSPEHRSLWRSDENIARYRALVRDTATADHIPFLDFYDSVPDPIPAEGFFDNQHLNLTGARIVTNLVTQLSLVDLFRHSPSAGMGSLSDLAAPADMQPGASAPASVTVADVAGGDLSGARLAYRWIDTLGYATGPAAVAPGAPGRSPLSVTAPALPGTYVLEVVLSGGSDPSPIATARRAVAVGTPGTVFASDDLFRATLSQLQVPRILQPGLVVHGSITVRNDSPDPWPGINLSYHWLDAGGNVVVHDGLRTALPKNVRTGETIHQDFAIEGPPQPGTYTLVVDLVYEEVGWFGSHGNPTPQQQVQVESASGGAVRTGVVDAL